MTFGDMKPDVLNIQLLRSSHKNGAQFFWDTLLQHHSRRFHPTKKITRAKTCWNHRYKGEIFGLDCCNVLKVGGKGFLAKIPYNFKTDKPISVKEILEWI